MSFETELCATEDCGGEDVSLFRASKIALGTKVRGDVADWETALWALRGGGGLESRIRWARLELDPHELSNTSFLLRGEWTKRGLWEDEPETEGTGEEAE